MALNSAREAGISVPDATIEKATKYVLSCQDEDSGGFRYQPGGGEPGFARSAAGVMSLIMCGQLRHKATQRGLAFLKAYPDRKFDKNYPRFHYSHYYAIQAMYQAGESDSNPGIPGIAATIVSKQQQDGSWREPRHGLRDWIFTSSSGALPLSTDLSTLSSRPLPDREQRAPGNRGSHHLTR